MLCRLWCGLQDTFAVYALPPPHDLSRLSGKETTKGALHYRRGMGSLGDWAATGPNPASAGGSAAVTGAGTGILVGKCVDKK